MGFYEDYCKAARSVFKDTEPDIILTAALMLSSIVIMFAGLYFDLMLSALLAVVIFDLAVGYPIYKWEKRKSDIEKALPDVLSNISTTLKSGGTIDIALRDVSTSNYGPITFELKKMLREIKEGKTFEEAFTSFGERSDSRIVRRSVYIIISAKRTGGGLVAALASIADDLRENARLVEERKTRTTAQVMFIIIAANFVAPFIFGIVSGLILFLGSIGGEIPPLFDTLLFYFKGYLIISAIFSAFAASLIKDGKITSAVVYTPILLLVTYTIFMVVSSAATTFFGV